MAVAFDATASASGVGVTSLSWSHTCSGANRGLAVGSSFVSAAATVSSVTYGAATLVAETSVRKGASNEFSDVRSLTAAASGTATVTATYSASVTAVSGSTSFTGTDQVDVSGATATNSATNANPSLTLTSGGSDGLFMNVAWTDSTLATIAADAPATERWDLKPGSSGFGEGTDLEGSATAITSTIGEIIGATWAAAGFVVQVASSASGGATSNLADWEYQF